MPSGMVACLLAVIATAFSNAIGTTDPQTLAEFQRSGARDLATYVAGGWLAAGINRLLIGLVVGSLGGLAGGAIGVAIRTSRTASPGVP